MKRRAMKTRTKEQMKVCSDAIMLHHMHGMMRPFPPPSVFSD